MYESFFGLKECPFNVTPDPRFLYLSSQHQDALSSLIYGIQSRRGFLQLSGEIGAGKTTLCRMILSKLGPDVHTSLVINPRLSEFELLQAIVEDFGIQPKGRKRKDYFDALNKFLIEEHNAGKNALVIIDEAHMLTPKALEAVRLLSNFETNTSKLLQIILAGQPELKDLLNRQDLVQLKQRVTIRTHLTELSREEAGNYLAHRLKVAGANVNFFTAQAIDRIHEISGGIPRVINVLADRALMTAYTQGLRLVETAMVDYANADIQGAAA